jgi:hypothetical protein
MLILAILHVCHINVFMTEKLICIWYMQLCTWNITHKFMKSYDVGEITNDN